MSGNRNSNNKRPRQDGATANNSTSVTLTQFSPSPTPSDTSSSSSARPSKQAKFDASAADNDDAAPTADAAWQKLYAPLPASMQASEDRTQSIIAAASSAAVSVASAVSGSSFVPAFISTLLPNVAQFEANYNSKLKDKNLTLDNTKSGSAVGSGALGDTSSKITRKRRRKRGVRMMSSNARKAAGLNEIPKKDIKYALFEPLHQLWVSYVHELLDPSSSRGLSISERVLKADYHGAILNVIRSRSPTHMGLKGIMIRETQEAFQIVTENNALKLLPKKGSIFSFTVPPVESDSSSSSSSSSAAISSSPVPLQALVPAPARVFELYGDHMCFRSYERSARKFKAKATIQL